jgi:murein L,D-transpeptidase YafK
MNRVSKAKRGNPLGAAKGFWSCLLALLLLPAGQAKAGEIWIDIDTGRHILYVMDGEHILREFANISVGRNGVAADRLLGDQKTPLGEYRVLRINRESRFHLFFGFDYPTMDQATSALRAGNITSEDWQAINQAHQEGREPPANTPLGGYIGIHGVGQGDARIHDSYDWTEGCVAVTNEQVDELALFIQLGTRVTLR